MRSVLIFAAALLAWSHAAAAGDKIRLGYPAGMNGQIVSILDRADLAKKQELDVDYSFFQNGPPMMEAFAAGHLDIAVTSLMPLATYAARLPGTAVIISGLGHSTYGVLVGSDSNVTQLADLKGTCWPHWPIQWPSSPPIRISRHSGSVARCRSMRTR